MPWLLIVYAAGIIGIFAWLTIIALRFKGTLKEVPLPENPPPVSTIVPARNEERNIGRCAAGITAQDYPALEMIFVDDDSEDRTGEILAEYAARDPRLKVIHTGGKPADWNGKQWACHSGAQHATGEWLCFMDADTYAEPQLLTRTVSFAASRGIDMLTLQPWYEMRGLWERIVLPAGLVPLLLIFPPDSVNDRRKKISMANGQFILIRREAYDTVQGHEGVKNRMMDDFSLAENVKNAGLYLFVAEGMDYLRVRLYTNLREIWSGALKAAVQITGGWVTSVLGLIGNLLLNLLPVILLVWAIVTGNTAAELVMGLTVLFQIIYYSTIRMIAFRMPPWTGLTYPIGGVIVTIILIDGLIRVASGGDIKWKGRDVQGRPELDIPNPIKTE